MVDHIYHSMLQAASAVQRAANDCRNSPILANIVDGLVAHADDGAKVTVTGMGKIGYVGRRFAQTLASTGTPAFFLHPAEALHGDLGQLSSRDVLFALSNSGKTREVLETVAAARGLHPSLWIVTLSGQPMQQPVAQLAGVLACTYGIVEEACPLGLTPTTSLAVVSAILDGIALSVMVQRGFTAADYAVRHHSGYLGEQARRRMACQ